MTFEQFAKKSGMVLVECEPIWGGTIGYKTSLMILASFVDIKQKENKK